MRTIAMLGCVLSVVLVPAINCIEFPPGQACTAIFVYGLSATVRDADTGEPIDNAILTLRDGNYTEVMELLVTGSYAGAGERAGTYDLTIEVPGAATDTISEIEITADECHVQGLALDIRVAPGQITVIPLNFACTEEARAGVSVKVTSAATGQPVTNATLTLTEGDYTEVLQGGPQGQYAGAIERRGTYTLAIDASGFELQVIENIEVTQGVCHVNTIALNVQLQPAP